MPCWSSRAAPLRKTRGGSDGGGGQTTVDAELEKWFAYPDQKAFVMLKWIDATLALKKMEDQPHFSTARSTWLSGCRVMRMMKENYSAVCNMLDWLHRNRDREDFLPCHWQPAPPAHPPRTGRLQRQ